MLSNQFDEIMSEKISKLEMSGEKFVKMCYLIEYFDSKQHDEKATNNHGNHEHEKVSMVEMTNTTIDPRTVMIHLQNTSIAN